jgi:hypothetical protein
MSITATVTGGAVQLTGNPVIIICAGGSVPSGASEYMMMLRILSPDAKLEGAPLIDAITPNPDGTAIFDISSILDQPHEMVFDNSYLSKAVEYPLRAFNIQVQPGERYINSQGLLVENWFTVSSIFQMIKGGLSPRQNAMMKALGQTYYSKYITGRKFLTPRPWGDTVHPTQPVKLWLMVVADYQSLFKVKAYYSDGTDATATSELILNTDSLYELNCNPELHGLPMEPAYNKKILYFDVWVDFLGSNPIHAALKLTGPTANALTSCFLPTPWEVSTMFISADMVWMPSPLPEHNRTGRYAPPTRFTPPPSFRQIKPGKTNGK